MTEKLTLKKNIAKRKKFLFPTKIPYYKNPICLVKAMGNYVWDHLGNEYFDAIGGIVSISVGHNHKRIVDKIKSMLGENAIQHTTYLYLSDYMELLAQKVANVAPGDLKKCYFTNSGSEATEIAVMCTRLATGAQTVVAVRHCYHGGTNVPLSLCGHGSWKYPSQPDSAVVHAVEPNCYRCFVGATKGKCDLECANDIKDVIETTTCGAIAALILEPVMGVGGYLDPPVEYHKKAYDIIRNYGGKYISDEVQTGVGRTGKYFFAIEESGVVPDIISMAKGFGNGAPIGAVIANDECANAMKGKFHFNTFGGDPFQSMQASEVIDIVDDEQLIKNAHTMGLYLKRRFIELQKEFTLIGDVRGRGLLLGLELVKDPKSKEYATEEAAELMERAKDNGLLVGKGGLKGNVIRIAPSLNINKTDCDEIYDKLSASFKAIGS